MNGKEGRTLIMEKDNDEMGKTRDTEEDNGKEKSLELNEKIYDILCSMDDKLRSMERALEHLELYH